MEVITRPAEPAPRAEVVDALSGVFDRVVDAQAAGVRPPALQPAIEAARRAQAADNVVELADALERVAHGAIATLARLRLHCPDLVGGTR